MEENIPWLASTQTSHSVRPFLFLSFIANGRKLLVQRIMKSRMLRYCRFKRSSHSKCYIINHGVFVGAGVSVDTGAVAAGPGHRRKPATGALNWAKHHDALHASLGAIFGSRLRATG